MAMKRVPGVPVILAVLLGFVSAATATPQQTPGTPPTFKAGVDLVTVSVVVKNREGKPVTGLTRQDFELTDAGRVRNISDFRSDAARVSLAVLLDTSGSMQIDPKWTNAIDAITRLSAELQTGRDQIALLTFDSSCTKLPSHDDAGRRGVRLHSAVPSDRPLYATPSCRRAGRSRHGKSRRAVSW
jgi:hypothetical protein